MAIHVGETDPASRCTPRTEKSPENDAAVASEEHDEAPVLGGRRDAFAEPLRRELEDEWQDDEPRGAVGVRLLAPYPERVRGAPLSEFAAHLWFLRNGKLLRNENFRDPEEAARAVGLSRV